MTIMANDAIFQRKTETEQAKVRPRRSSGKTRTIPVHSRSATLLYAEAITTALVVVALSWLLRDALSGTRLLLFWVMSAFVAWRCGFGPVTVATVLGAVSWDVFIAPSPNDPSGVPWAEIVLMSVYVAVSMAMGLTVDRLRRAQLRVAQATNGMIDAMLVYDATWHLHFINEAGIALLRRVGIDVRQLKGRVFWEMVPSLIGTPFEVETRRAQSEQRVLEYEAQYPNADLWLRVRCVPTSDGGVAMFVHDVTTTRRAELERRRMEERYRALVEASTVMVWSSDSSGALNDVPVWRELTGQSTDELRGSGSR